MGENTRNEAKRQDTGSTPQVHVILILNGTRRYTPKHQCFSLFDYAVRELRFTDAAAQRRIQAMRLCRRHGWVRASLQSGELSMTAAGQLETTFAGAERAERAERQSRTGRRNVGGTRQLGLPAAPNEASEQEGRGRSLGSHMTALATNGAVAVDQSAPSPGSATDHQGRCPEFGRQRRFSDEPSALSARRAVVAAQPAGRLDARAATGSAAPQSALGRAPRSEQCSGDAETVNTPVASCAGAQAPGSGNAGTPLPELNGHDSTSPAPPCAPDAAPGAGAGASPAAPSSDDGPAPQLLPPTHLPSSTPVPEPEPVVAPSESRHTASRAPESSRDDPFAELSPGTVSAAPLLHPQRQRELIEQATSMSTRQIASLLAAAAPEVVPPRDTLRAVAPDRYSLKVSIDQECEQGLRLLKDLMSHVDPRMSWGDLVARLVRDAVARHDPRDGGSGRRRRSARNGGVSPRRAPNKTRAAGAAAGPAQRAHESSPRAPNRTSATGAPTAPARRGGGATPAPKGDTAASERRNPIAMLANAAPPQQSAPAALADGALSGGVPSGAPDAAAPPAAAPAATAASKFASRASVDGSHPGAGVLVSPVATAAPQPAADASVDGSHPGAGVPVSPVATSAPRPAAGGSPDGGPPDASARVAAHTTREPVHSRHQSPPRRHIPAAVRRHIWQRDGGRCCYRDPLSGRRCTSSHLLQIDHLLPVAEGGGPEPSNLVLRCFAHHRMRHGSGPGPTPEPLM